jgi:hypothetical protein
MLRSTCALFGTCLFAAALARADGVPLRGAADFADGRGHLVLGGGVADFGVERIGTGLEISIDGQTVATALEDRIGGKLFGGNVSYVLPHENERTWFGRRTRLMLGVFHGWADKTQVAFGDDATTVDTALFYHMASPDGRAFGQSTSATTGASAFTAAYGGGSAFADVCTDTNGSVAANAVAAGLSSAVANCTAGPTSAFSESLSADPGSTVSAVARAIVLSGTPFTADTIDAATHDIEDTRVEFGMEGDYDIGSEFSLAPSFAVVGGRRQLKFMAENGVIAADGATSLAVIGIVAGTLVSKDLGVQAGSRAGYRIAPGVELFAAAKAALLHRRVDMDSSGAIAGTVGAGYFAVTSSASSAMAHEETRAAFQGRFEAGGSYAFDPGLGLGPLRATLTGGLAYDSAVANYQAVKSSPALDAPFAPAEIGFAAETDYYAKAELTLELP